MSQERLHNYEWGKIYPMYVNKVERKEQSKEDLDDLINWLTGYPIDAIESEEVSQKTLREFFDDAPEMNTNKSLITGVICGIRVENIEDPLTQDIRYMDKIVDELAKGKKMEKIKRQPK